MKKDIKEKLKIASALTTLASGIVLSFLSFFLSSYVDNLILLLWQNLHHFSVFEPDQRSR